MLAEKLGRKRKKTCVEVACLNPCLAQQSARARGAVDLAVGRVENRSVEWRFGCAEQITTNQRNRSPNEILVAQLRSELNPASLTRGSARPQGTIKSRDNRFVNFVGGD